MLWIGVIGWCNLDQFKMDLDADLFPVLMDNKSIDQPARPRSLISAFAIHHLNCKKAPFVTCKFQDAS